MVMQHLAAGQVTYPIGDAAAQTRLYTTRRISKRRTLGEDVGMSSASSLTPGEAGGGSASSLSCGVRLFAGERTAGHLPALVPSRPAHGKGR